MQVQMGGVAKPTWCNAVDAEQIASGSEESAGAAILMGTYVIAPGDSTRVEATIWGVPEAE